MSPLYLLGEPSQLLTHLLKNVSNNCAECGNPSTRKSNGRSHATAAMLAGASRCSTAAASRNCLPSDSTSTLRSTSFGLVGDARSRLIRSPHSRISPHRPAAGLWMLDGTEEAERLAGINTERHTDTLGGRGHGSEEEVESRGWLYFKFEWSNLIKLMLLSSWIVIISCLLNEFVDSSSSKKHHTIFFLFLD